jgi:hypothetical protein
MNYLELIVTQDLQLQSLVGSEPESEDFKCERNLILVPETFDGDVDTFHQIQLLISFKMSLCMLLLMYVIYSLCRIAFNYKQRDVLTTAIQALFCASLFCKPNFPASFFSLVRSWQISSNLIVLDTPEGIERSYVAFAVFFYLADFCFESAIVCQMALW